MGGAEPPTGLRLGDGLARRAAGQARIRSPWSPAWLGTLRSRTHSHKRGGGMDQLRAFLKAVGALAQVGNARYWWARKRGRYILR